jgi:hypothetical protein
MFFPKIIITVLVILGLTIVVPEIVRKVRAGQPVFSGHSFFYENYDKVKLFGTLALLVLYVFLLDLFGFLPASLLCIFLFNVLFCGTLEKKSLLVSAGLTVVFVMFTWLVFGQLLNITLP